MTSADKIAEALFAALIGGGDIEELRSQVETFKAKYGRSYQDVRKQRFAGKLLEAIEEAIAYAS
jgi:hypothetical protein